MTNKPAPLSVLDTLDDVEKGTVTNTAPDTETIELNVEQSIDLPQLPISKSIYAANAAQYIQKGISVIPLMAEMKRPAFKNWELYANTPVPPAQALTWMADKTNYNIGLVLGKQSNIVAVDIDTDDPAIIANVEKLLPKAYWIRVGKKGCVLAYKHNPAIKNKFHLSIVDPKNPDSDKGIQIIDFLTTGSQIVLPPSIHPDTKKPYIENTSLISVLDKLPQIPDNIYQLLVQAIEDSGYSLFRKKSSQRLSVPIANGQRDNELTRHAGVFAQDVIKGNINLKQAFDLMQDIYDLYVEKNKIDDIDIEKQKNNIVRFIFRDLETYNKVLPVGWDAELDPKFISELGLTSEQTELSYQEITREAKFRIEEAGEGGSYLTINWAVNKLAQRQKPDILQEQQLLEFLIERARKIDKSTLRVSDLKRQLKEKRKEALETANVNGEKLDLKSHTAVAKAAINDLQQTTPILTEYKIMYQWVGTHWKVYEIDHVKQYLATRYADLDITRRNSDFEGIFKQMLVLSHGKLSKSTNSYINLNNGVLLDDGKFVNHDPKYGATYVLPYDYKPDLADPENAPMFFKYLDDCWGHTPDYQDRIKSLQEIMCASCLGIATKFQRAVLLFGGGGSGKSVLLEIVRNMFPDEARSSVNFDKLQDTSHLTMLNNKIINIVGELSNRNYIEGSIFKMVIAGEQTTGRYLFNEAFNLIPKAAHWAASNHLPKSSDSSMGFVRRWLIFDFEKTVMNPDLEISKKIVSKELEAIFAWAIEARTRVVGDYAKLTIPISSTQKQEELHIGVNPVKHFLMKDTQLVFAEFNQVAEYELYMRFRTFLMQTVGIKRILAMNEFSQIMIDLSRQWAITLTKSDDNVTYYHGIKIKD